MNKKIIFSAGGTGGHIFPAINLMKHFYDIGYEVILVTDKRGNSFLEDNKVFKSYIIDSGTPTNKNIIKKIYSLFIILYSLLRAILILKKERPNLVIGFGGYVSFPICYASKFFKLPLIIYEANLILGRTNKYLLSFAKKIFLSRAIKINFPEKFKKKVYEVGTILDKNIINYPALKKNHNKDNFSILILGGSQGAKIFGTIIPPAIKMIKDDGHNIEIYHQCIKNQKDFIKTFYDKNNIKNYVFEFDKNVFKLIASTDLAITRCGASTTAELAHMLTPFIAVPLKNSIDNHQHLNAKFYENKGCCWILEQNNLNTNSLFGLITEIIKNKNKLKMIQDNMKKIYSNKVYNLIEKEIKESVQR